MLEIRLSKVLLRICCFILVLRVHEWRYLLLLGWSLLLRAFISFQRSLIISKYLWFSSHAWIWDLLGTTNFHDSPIIWHHLIRVCRLVTQAVKVLIIVCQPLGKMASWRLKKLISLNFLKISDVMLRLHPWDEVSDWLALRHHLEAPKPIGRKSIDVNKGRLPATDLTLDDVALYGQLEIVWQNVRIEMLLRICLRRRFVGWLRKRTRSGGILLEIWLIWNLRGFAHSMNKLAPNSVRTVELIHKLLAESRLVLRRKINLGLKLVEPMGEGALYLLVIMKEMVNLFLAFLPHFQTCRFPLFPSSCTTRSYTCAKKELWVPPS